MEPQILRPFGPKNFSGWATGSLRSVDSLPLKTQEILSSLEMVNQIREPETQLHLLGVTRCGFVNEFSAEWG